MGREVLCGGPNRSVVSAGELLLRDGVDVEAERGEALHETRRHDLHPRDSGEAGDGRRGEVFLGGGGGDDGAEVVLGEGREVFEDLPGAGAFGQAREERSERDRRAADDGFAPTEGGVVRDADGVVYVRSV
jgi:hypothetical protein